MRVTFVLPGYYPSPIGGYRVVFEYADYLASRGHQLTLVFPRRRTTADQSASPLEAVKGRLWGLRTRLANRPLVPWHALHSGIKLALVPLLTDGHVPGGDAVIATAWSTAQLVAALSKGKGKKFYLIQHHETWDGPTEQVNATWRLPLHKIVISKWLLELGRELGATDLRYIPNGIDFRRFRTIVPPRSRPLSIVSMYSTQQFKGVPDALAVLGSYHEHFPTVPVSMFGVPPRGAEIPDWIQYYRNPDQEFLVEQIFNRHSICLSASLTEGWGLPPAEAMACGCAFVGTDIGGFREFATHGETALLSPPGDRAGLLRNLTSMTEDASLRGRIQQRGTDHIQRFTWKAAGSALEDYLLHAD